ncbi:MAG: DUF373 family protein [Candidatus Bathyarchaeia archaeon]
MAETGKEPKNLVILCVDRDDDIGTKTGIPTPLVGRDAVLNAATQLIVRDPEEADANTLFESLKVLDLLRSRAKDETYEVAAIAGSSLGEIEADRKIAREVQEVLERSSAEAAILISDGYTDQAVSPIIQSYVPIVSVRRFAVRHSEGLETSWFIFTRYLKVLVTDERYVRWTLGVPGILLLILTSFFALSIIYPQVPFATYGAIAALVLVGAALVIRGFGIDRAARSLVSGAAARPSVLVNAFGTVAGTVICILGIPQGIARVQNTAPAGYMNDLWSFLSYGNLIAAAFIEGAVDYFMIGVSVMLIGRGVYYFFVRSEKMWSSSVGVVAAILVSLTLRNATTVLRVIPDSVTDPTALAFFTWVILGILLTILSIMIVHRLKLRFSGYFTRVDEA